MGKEVIHHLSQAAKVKDIRVVAAARDIHKGSNFTSQGVEVCFFLPSFQPFRLLLGGEGAEKRTIGLTFL